MENEHFEPSHLPISQTADTDNTSISATVLLFNDDYHTFEEVAGQIIKATRYNPSKAKRLTWIVHTQGKALVFTGDIQICIKISDTLEEIDLRTRIEY